MNWADLPWEAIATFCAGLLAVLGASVVAWKQGKILQLQLDSQNRQIDQERQLRETEIKLRLLEQRSGLIAGLRNIWYAFVAEANLTREQQVELNNLINQIDFIFPFAHSEKLQKILSDSSKLISRTRAMNALRLRDNDQKSDQYLDEIISIEQGIFENLPAVIDEMVKHSSVPL